MNTGIFLLLPVPVLALSFTGLVSGFLIPCITVVIPLVDLFVWLCFPHIFIFILSCPHFRPVPFLVLFGVVLSSVFLPT